MTKGMVTLLAMMVALVVMILPGTLVLMMAIQEEVTQVLVLLVLLLAPVTLGVVVRVVALQEDLEEAHQEVAALEEALRKEAKAHRVLRQMEEETTQTEEQ